MRLIDRNPKTEPIALDRRREQPIANRGIHVTNDLHASGWPTVGINDFTM
jgi:hypothetical protein